MNFEQLLKFAAGQNASDIHLAPGMTPMLRIDGALRGVEGQTVNGDELCSFLESIAPREVAADLKRAASEGTVFVHTLPDTARLRCRLFSHLGQPGLSLRLVPLVPPSLEALGLPTVVRDIALGRQGLVLIAGESGSGRTTTLAAMLHLIHQAHVGHIITVEEAVEFAHPPGKSLITHRWVGLDTPSVDQGLAQAIRNDPDVLAVGAVRDANTARLVLQATGPGRQVFGVLDAGTSIQAVERLIGMLPSDERSWGTRQVASALDAVIAQRLVATKAGKRRVAVEVLRGGPMVARSLTEGRMGDLPNFLAGRQGGMQSFDQDLVALYLAGQISGTEAMKRSTSPEAVASQLRTSRATSA